MVNLLQIGRVHSAKIRLGNTYVSTILQLVEPLKILPADQSETILPQLEKLEKKSKIRSMV
jgi:hypothetical protein